MADEFKIIVITAESPVKGECEAITRLLRAGVDRIHIRKPEVGEMYVDKLLSGIPSDFMSRISLHDYPGLAVKYGTGFHTGRRTSVIPNVKPLSRSCHSLSEVAASSTFDYVTLSPVYDSISKQGYSANHSFDRFNARDFSVPVIALGGVTAGNLGTLNRRGFAGAAMLGDVWHTPGGVDRLVSMLRLRNFRLQFITNGAGVETTVCQAVNAMDGGCRWIQVRMKKSPVEELTEAVSELLPICRSRGVTLLVNDNFEVCGITGADGVHIGQNDEKPSTVRKALGNDMIIGLTVNTLEQLPDALKQPTDYFGIGPYRFTQTKEKLAPVLGLDGYRQFMLKMTELEGRVKPFVAIGGIGIDDVPPLLEAGVPGIAVSGAISHSENPIETTRNFINTINRNGR